MPELPEVETTRRGIQPHLVDVRIGAVVVRQRRLRWPIPRRLEQDLPGQRVESVRRRAKYLLLATGGGAAILHLGMSGSLRIVDAALPPGNHDHVDLVLESGTALRFRDPRRFGALLWTRRDPERHRLLADLGPEPLDDVFDGTVLHAAARGRRVPIRNLLLDGRVVAGVGNIYANEAVFRAGIRPDRAAGRISRRRLDALAATVKEVLRDAIARGGTTLRDFTRVDGEPGYFSLELDVYGREGEPCHRCGGVIHRAVLGQRSIFYCVGCQR